MSEVTYEIVEHDGGWAYKVGGVFSEPFPTHAAALKAAQAAAVVMNAAPVAGRYPACAMRLAVSLDSRETLRACDRRAP